MQLKPNQINRDTKTLSAISQLRKYDKIKFLAETATLALLISSYPLAALSMGFTFQQIIFSGSSPLMVISSQSMRPTLEYGDLILMKGSKTEDLVTGDIIAFKVPSPYDRVASSPTVHRVVGKWSENGEIYFKTKGDGNSEPDSWTVPADNVLGTYAQLKIPYVGSLVIFLKSPFGLALLILCLFLVFLYGYYKKRE
jgi:signal peptidase